MRHLLIIILFLVIFIHFVEGPRKKLGLNQQARIIRNQLGKDMKNANVTPQNAQRKMNIKLRYFCMTLRKLEKVLGKTKIGGDTKVSSEDCCDRKPTFNTFVEKCKPYLKELKKLVKKDPKLVGLMKDKKRKTREKRNISIRRWETMNYFELTMRRNIRMAFITKTAKNVANGIYTRGKRIMIPVKNVLTRLEINEKEFYGRFQDRRRHKRQIAEGIFAGMFILAGLWFGYLALVCFLSIIFPPFIFAMMFTMGFGLIAWFCLKVSDKLLGESEEEEVEAEDFDGVNDLEPGYGGGGKKRGNYQMMQPEYDYDQNGGFMPYDPNVYYPNGGEGIHFANQQQLQFNAGGGYGGDHLHSGYAYSTNRGGNNKRTKLYGGG